MAALSRLDTEVAASPDTSQYLTFTLGSDVFAMDIRSFFAKKTGPSTSAPAAAAVPAFQWSLLRV